MNNLIDISLQPIHFQEIIDLLPMKNFKKVSYLKQCTEIQELSITIFKIYSATSVKFVYAGSQRKLIFHYPFIFLL